MLRTQRRWLPQLLAGCGLRSRDFILNPAGIMGPFVCGTAEEIARPLGDIPHALPGENKYLTEFATLYGIPLEAARGGAATMYPEYRRRLVTLPVPQAHPPDRRGTP